MEATKSQIQWQINWLKPHLPWNKQAIRPAEIGDGLCRVMMAQENLLEDANYKKIVPNRYVVELCPENYQLHYKPIESSLVQQWRERVVEHLMTANSRLGQKEYRFGGPVQIVLRAAPDIKLCNARVLCRIEPDLQPDGRMASAEPKNQPAAVAFLDLVPGERSWPLHPGDNTIGRAEGCDVYLDLPQVQEKRLVSSQHAILHIEPDGCFLFDGSIAGKHSANGTYVNSQRIPEQGIALRGGEMIILAALDPSDPRVDTPGVAALRFRKNSPSDARD